MADIPESVRALTGLEPGEIIITRRLSRQGRNRCYINDTAVTLGTMAEVIGGLLSFAGQHEYRRLLDPGYQLAVLDQWAGADVVALAAEFREALRQRSRDHSPAGGGPALTRGSLARDRLAAIPGG